MKYAAYLRVSSEDQKERSTILNQVEFLNKYCDLHELELVESYKDDGVTGTLPLQERPEGKRLLDDAKNKMFDVLLIYKLDRLGRSTRVTLNAIYDLEKFGVQIKSMTEPFDTSSPAGSFAITMLAGVADLERSTILERMWHGANRAARNGKWLGGIVPYGYFVNEEGYLEVNENPISNFHMSEADVIRLIYDLVSNQGYSTIKVADYLNAVGVPPSYSKDNRKIKKGKRIETTAGIWRPGRIRGIIVNTTYKGIHEYGKRSKKERELIIRDVPAIVDVDTWDKAQATLKNNQLESLRNSKRYYLLRGLVKCGSCGLSYVGAGYYGENRKIKAYYVCDGKNKYNGPTLGKCKSKNIPAEYLEELVWNDVVNFINYPGEILKKIDNEVESKKCEKENFEKEKKLLTNILTDKQNEKQSILDLYRKKIISVNDVENQIEKINTEVTSIEIRIKELNRMINDNNNYKDKYNAAEELLNALKERIKGKVSDEEKRDIIKLLIKEIKVNTIPSPRPNGRANASIYFIYNFDSMVVTYTDALVAIMDTSLRNADALKCKLETILARFPHHSWIELIFILQLSQLNLRKLTVAQRRKPRQLLRRGSVEQGKYKTTVFQRMEYKTMPK